MARLKKSDVAAKVEATARTHRAIQKETDAKDAKTTSKKEESGAMQAGHAPYPEPPFPKQHLKKPGNEWQLDPPPSPASPPCSPALRRAQARRGCCGLAAPEPHPSS